ncbi:sulfite exporter TauE/SafE family protein [Anaerotalea alkaliphila]|uniref:Probable membrane transporter protein n=1 Tax=Anaerotalea alkaliphila TaxID=2662126 RepID=A0A7X5KNP7_9FIRM|nr:sulfite exporter TauE/SafE family protein [Anaerotalea alkaliphila]NDL68249.1 sulfite exporter TauE/SafE family protein [Anaerotalea alkaliphila]
MGVTDFLGFELWQWAGIAAVALMVGMAKAGISGTVMLAVPLLASVVGGKMSTGMMVSLFIVGDIFAVLFYKQHVDGKIIRRLMGWVAAGILLGLVVGKYIDDQQFKTLLAGIVILILGMIVYMEVRGDKIQVPEKLWVYALTGILCGFTSMIGNMAGPIFNIYLLALGLGKKNFMGTLAVFFFITNLIKLPLQIFFWNNVTLETAGVVLVMVPVVLLGAVIGVRIIRVLNDRIFRRFVLVMTTLAAIRLLLQ